MLHSVRLAVKKLLLGRDEGKQFCFNGESRVRMEREKKPVTLKGIEWYRAQKQRKIQFLPFCWCSSWRRRSSFMALRTNIPSKHNRRMLSLRMVCSSSAWTSWFCNRVMWKKKSNISFIHVTVLPNWCTCSGQHKPDHVGLYKTRRKTNALCKINMCEATNYISQYMLGLQ